MRALEALTSVELVLDLGGILMAAAALVGTVATLSRVRALERRSRALTRLGRSSSSSSSGSTPTGGDVRG